MYQEKRQDAAVAIVERAWQYVPHAFMHCICRNSDIHESSLSWGFVDCIVQTKDTPTCKAGKIASNCFLKHLAYVWAHVAASCIRYAATLTGSNSSLLQPCPSVAMALQTLQAAPRDIASSLLMALEDQAESSGGEMAHAVPFAAQLLLGKPQAAVKARVTSPHGSGIGERGEARSTKPLSPLASSGSCCRWMRKTTSGAAQAKASSSTRQQAGHISRRHGYIYCCAANRSLQRRSFVVLLTISYVRAGGAQATCRLNSGGSHGPRSCAIMSAAMRSTGMQSRLPAGSGDGHGGGCGGSCGNVCFQLLPKASLIRQRSHGQQPKAFLM